jgi:hypothetical protein
MSCTNEFYDLCEQYGFVYDKIRYDGLVFVFTKDGGRCRIYTLSEVESPTDAVKGDLLMMFMEKTWKE